MSTRWDTQAALDLGGTLDVWEETGVAMAQKWSRPEYSRGQIDKAGGVLISDFGALYPHNWDASLAIINNWRSSHSYPLQSMKMVLKGRAKKVDERAVVAQRLKRLTSIAVKLRRNKNMALSQMQDIGGCRAIVRSGPMLKALVKLYDAAEYAKKYDYITNPKDDGYRSTHFVFKYKSNRRQNKPYIGLRIEIQLRSRLQHAWATAVETVDSFSAQQIKTGGGEESWRRFFALMSSAIAHRERCPSVPGTPDNISERTSELRALVNDLHVISVLQGWSTAVQRLPIQAKAGSQVFLLLLDTDANTLQITSFTDVEGAKASAHYLETEEEIARRPSAQAVLVSVESVRALQGAYPNYFVDTRAFIDAVKRAVA